VGLPAIPASAGMQEEPVEEIEEELGEEESLAPALERVTRLALQKLTRYYGSRPTVVTATC